MINQHQREFGIIRETSYGRAVEQAINAAENGQTPLTVIHSVNMTWRNDNPTWDDAIYILAYAWRRRCSTAPKTAFDIHHPATSTDLVSHPDLGPAARRKPAPNSSSDTKRIIKCMQVDCSNEFLSTGNGHRHCPKCRRRIKRKSGAIA